MSSSISKRFSATLLALSSGCASNTPARAPASVDARVEQALGRGVELLKQKAIEGPDGLAWRWPTRLGLHFSSQYFLMKQWLGRAHSRLDEGRLREYILNEQLPDGSWFQVRDANAVAGNLDSTIFNYWALKALGQPDGRAQAALSKARAYILGRGGLEQAAIFTKVLLALHGNYPWSRLPEMPLIMFTAAGDRHIVQKFSQWVIPHLRPMGYLKHHRIVKRLGPDFALAELGGPAADAPVPVRASAAPSALVQRLAETLILNEQNPRGSWGGYSLATLFSAVALDHYRHHYLIAPETAARIAPALERGFDFVETLYFDSGESSYHGVLDDNTYWDTGLALWALGEAGDRGPERERGAKFLAGQQQADGGVPFGYDFWRYADIDDTYAAWAAFEGVPGFAAAQRRTENFALGRANRDGGWGTFEVDNTGNLLLNLGAGKVGNSADLYDESEPDVTGHALELIARHREDPKVARLIEQGIAFLRKTRDPRIPAWRSRWEVNYLFGTASVLAGLHSVGVSPQEPLVADAVQWLQGVQNGDGGFGESTLSYSDIRWAGHGISTASQTSWGLMALVSGGAARSAAAQRAARYLADELAREGHWSDPSATGTGHPGILYMEYPSYPYVFPVIALGRYLRALCESAPASVTPETCAHFKYSPR